MRLLVTRPGEDGKSTATRLREMGHEPVLEPLLEIVFLEPPSFNTDGIQALVATSANGIRALAHLDVAQDLKSIPIMTIGEASSSAARKSGFTNVLVGGGTLPTLAQDIARNFLPENGTILYLAGRARSGDLSGLLAKAGFSTQTVILYEAIRANCFTDNIVTQIRNIEIDGVLHFSERSADIYAGLIRSSGLEASTKSITHYCLSQQVAKNLDPKIFDPDKIYIATEPTLDSILASIEKSTK